MEASQRGEVNRGVHDAMWRGHGGWEMSLTPVLFGAFGWMLDGWIGIRPVLTVVFAIMGLAGSVANQYFQYTHRMRVLAEERTAARAAANGAIR